MADLQATVRRARSGSCVGYLPCLALCAGAHALTPATTFGAPLAAAVAAIAAAGEPANRPIEALWRHVQAQSSQAGVQLRADDALARAASALLPWARHHAGESLPADLLKQAAWQQQVTDAELAGVAITSSPDGLVLALSAGLARVLADNDSLNRVGLAREDLGRAEADGRGSATLVLLLSRRLVALTPPWPLRAALGPTGRVCGYSLLPNLGRVQLLVGGAKGLVESRATALASGQRRPFCVTLPRADAPLHALAQLVVERGQGPELAAEWPLLSPAEALAAQRQASMAWRRCAREKSASAKGSPQALLAQLNSWRRQVRRKPLRPDRKLAALAAAHADDMAVHRFFAHRSPANGNAAERAAHSGYPFQRIVENIAASASLEGAFAQWQQSLAHRQNLLDPDVERMGLGAANKRDGSGGCLVVLLLAD